MQKMKYDAGLKITSDSLKQMTFVHWPGREIQINPEGRKSGVVTIDGQFLLGRDPLTYL